MAEEKTEIKGIIMTAEQFNKAWPILKKIAIENAGNEPKNE